MKTLRYILLALVCVLTLSETHAQTVSKGDRMIGVGIGFFNQIRPSGFTTNLPPIQLQYEHGLFDNFTLSGLVGFSTSSFIDKGYRTIPFSPYVYEYQEYEWNVTNIVIGLKGTYYFDELIDLPDNLVPYGSLMLAHNIVSENVTMRAGSEFLNPSLDPVNQSESFVGLVVGAKYFLGDNLSIYGEFGKSIALFQFGASAKF